MAEPIDQTRDRTYRRLCAAAASLLAREGVSGVFLVDGDGDLVLSFGEGPQPDTEAILLRLAAAARVAAGLAPGDAGDEPVYVQDGYNRVYVRSLAHDLILMVGCVARWPAGLLYRLVDGPAGVMCEALAALPTADAATSAPPDPEPDPGDAGVFWE